MRHSIIRGANWADRTYLGKPCHCRSSHFLSRFQDPAQERDPRAGDSAQVAAFPAFPESAQWRDSKGRIWEVESLAAFAIPVSRDSLYGDDFHAGRLSWIVRWLNSPIMIQMRIRMERPATVNRNRRSEYGSLSESIMVRFPSAWHR
jgi:hypothetical protein